MAQPINRQNTIRRDRSKAGGSSKEGPTTTMKWESWRSDQRTHLVLGGVFLALAIGLLLAFISYLITGPADQSVLTAAWDTPIRESGAEVRNWLGVLGAYIAHVFIFRWFGIAALGLPLILFLAGWKLSFGRELLPLGRITKATLFYMVWVSLLAGYIVLATSSVDQKSAWCGGLGYEVNIWLKSLLGWGGIAVLGLVLFVFIIYFYNITSLSGWSASSTNSSRTTHLGSSTSAVQPPSVADGPVDDWEGPSGSLSPSADKDTEDDFILDRPPVELVASSKPAEMFLESNLASLKQSSLMTHGKSVPLTIAETPIHVKEVAVNQSIPEPYAGPADEVDGDLVEAFSLYDSTLDLPKYQFPTFDLLTEHPENQKAQVTTEELEANKNRIVDTLQNYGITIDSIKATIGPTVTLYEIVPSAGVRISKIKSLEDDIALNLAALGIRIIAPMPGKGTIGIEVPNKNREMVSIRSVIISEKFVKNNFELPIVMGKTISNEIYVADLAKMPHLLMAGATGQGKSVGLNVLLTSLIYRKHPSQLKLVLVDPKKVELTLFNKLERHFLATLPGSIEPIITDTKKVVNTLNSLCIEMDNRYNLLKDASCRNLKEYNGKFVQRRLNPEKGHRFLPYIVLIIDELADLMMTAGKEVEQPIARLAQLARAIGIHLVVATQRPSVNVITGLIKANFPARLSFKVTSKIDSRTILDTGGAEQLVGMGDMLFSSNSDIIRLQCPFIDTNEIEEICEFVGSQRGYDSAYSLPEFEGDEGGNGEDREIDFENRDPMFDDAARLVVTHQQGSTSLIQRRLKLGYNRAGRLIDQLEAAGIVGPFEGSKAREVLIQDTQMLEERLKGI